MFQRILKGLTLVLAVVLLLSIAVGCSGKSVGETESVDSASESEQEDANQSSNGESEPEEEEPTYDFGGRVMKYVAAWDLEPKAGSSEGADKMIQRITELEEKYNFTTEYVNIEMNQLLEQYTSSVMAGEPLGDIVYVWSYWFYPGFVSAGMVYPASDLEAFDFTEEKWNQEVIDFATYKDKVYGFDTGRTFPRGALFWNKTIFEREALPNLYELQNSNTWTWDQLVEVAQKATKDLDGDGIVDQWGLGGVGIDFGIIFSNDADVVRMGENGKPAFVLTEAKAIKAMQFYQDLVHKYKVFNIPPEGAAWDYPMEQFAVGKSAMLYGEWWMADRFNPNMADDYGYVVFPKGPDASSYIVRESEKTFPVIPSTAEKPEEIAIVWDARTEPFPGEDPESWKEAYEGNARDAETIDTIEMIQDDKLSKLDIHLGFREVTEMMWTTMWQVYSGNKTPQVAAEEVAQQAQAALDAAWERVGK